MGGQSGRLTRLVYETIDHYFIAEQLNANVAAGVNAYAVMPEARVGFLISGATETDIGVSVAFASKGTAAKTVLAGGDPKDIFVLRA